MASASPIKGLYYPHLQFESEGWLKAALLYWEGLVRLVPPGFIPWDSPEVHELVTSGLIEDVSPEPFRHRAAERYIERLEDLPRGAITAPTFAASGDSALVHIEKMERGLLEELERRSLAASAREWATMPAELAALYEMTLASEAGRELHTALATSEFRGDVAGAYFAQRRLAENGNLLAPVDGFACARMLEPFAEIEESGALSAASLLRVRARTFKQRRAFREQVQRQATQLADLPSADAVRSHMEDFTESIRAEVQAERRQVRAAHLAEAWRLVRISAPASVGAAVSLAGAPPLIAAVGVVGSLGVGVTDWVLQHRQSPGSGGHYLVSLQAAIRSERARGLRSEGA